MRALIRPFTMIILSCGLLFIAGAAVRADIHVYGRRDDSGPFFKIGVIRTGGDGNAGGGDVAMMCEDGFDCFGLGDGGIACASCHAQAPSYEKFTSQQSQAHLIRHFPMAEMRLGEGQETTFARQKLRREGGRLVFVDPKGGKRPLPVGALLLKNKNGRPFAIVSSNPPY
jgi:hypothetical protein